MIRRIAALAIGMVRMTTAPTMHGHALPVATNQSPVGLDPRIAIVPALPESSTVSPDGLTNTFRHRSYLQSSCWRLA
jgi:hypothetical protein